MVRRCLAFLIVFFSLVVFAAAQEWTRFRGPNGQGQSESAAGTPTEFSEKDYNWKIELPGVGHSSPVLWGDKIFLTSADPETATRHVFCINAANGHTIWKRDYPGKTYKVHTQNSFASSTPAVDAERVYLAWASEDDNTLMALTHNGQDVWSVDLGPYKSQHGYGASPIVVDDMVVITNDQEGDTRFILAVDSKTGQERWKIPRKFASNGRQNASYATPILLDTPKGRELIICSWAHGITSHDLKTGAELWSAPVLKSRPVGSPVLAAGMIVANCGDGQEGKGASNSVIAIRPGTSDGKAAEVAYSMGKGSSPYVTTILPVGDTAILWSDGGIVSCIDAASGNPIWQKRVGGVFYSSPVRVGDRIYCMSIDGDVVVLAASKEYQLLARNSLGEGSNATPAVAGGRIYFRTQSHLISVGNKIASN